MEKSLYVREFGDRWSHHEEEIMSVRGLLDGRLLPGDIVRVCLKQERVGERDWCKFFTDRTILKLSKILNLTSIRFPS